MGRPEIQFQVLIRVRPSGPEPSEPIQDRDERYPDQRAKKEDWRLYGKKGGLAASIEVTADWNFLTPLGAHYVEQSIIHLLRSHGYKEIDKQYNWFEIDHEDLHFFLKGLKSFIAKTRKNAGDVLFQSDARRKDKPYGKFLWGWIKSLKSSSASNPPSN